MKSLHQVVRQLMDKSHRIRQQERMMVCRHDLAHRRIQRRKKHILLHHLLLFHVHLITAIQIQHGIQQRRFPGIRIAHQRHPGHSGSRTAFALRLPLRAHFSKLPSKLRQPPLQYTAVQFQFLLTGPLIAQ